MSTGLGAQLPGRAETGKAKRGRKAAALGRSSAGTLGASLFEEEE